MFMFIDQNLGDKVINRPKLYKDVDIDLNIPEYTTCLATQ